MPNYDVNNPKIYEKFESGRSFLVIGKNGSGKTRLLRKIESIRKEKCGANVDSVIYADFAHSSFSIDFKNKRFNNMTVVKYDTNINYISDYFHSVQETLDQFIDFIYDSTDQYDIKKELLSFINECFNDLFDSYYDVKTNTIAFHVSNKEKEIIIESAYEFKNKLKSSFFSLGEYFLLCMISFIVTACIKKQDKITIIMDEPENHLHPDVVIKFIRKIKRTFKESEIWVATHSIHLLAIFDMKDVVVVDSGEIIEKSENMYKNIVEKMIGDINAIDDLFADVTTREFLKYVDECSSEPGSSKELNGKEAIMPKDWTKNKEILDFGAGKCLFGKYLDTINSTSTYSAYRGEKEEFDKIRNKGLLYKELNRVEKKFDIILLVDTLHEISIEDWVKELQTIGNLLGEKGILVYSEPYALKYGEYPNNNGYIVLGKEEIKILFGVDTDNIFTDKNSTILRIAASIPRENIINFVNDKNLINALKSLDERLPVYYRDEFDKGNIRTAAFFSVMTMNVRYALELFDVDVKSEKSNSIKSIREKLGPEIYGAQKQLMEAYSKLTFVTGKLWDKHSIEDYNEITKKLHEVHSNFMECSDNILLTSDERVKKSKDVVLDCVAKIETYSLALTNGDNVIEAYNNIHTSHMLLMEDYRSLRDYYADMYRQ